ncbi:uncharacterized protein LOC135167385 isoform X2 [Diachasmimorpha longicaudata]|uniref:uncharacterized protein LOC135167385 isoform X2 n=1 Tax=Diachasmimorpha longicaudata TaxID=58733 RepID=UPI0030B90A36
MIWDVSGLYSRHRLSVPNILARSTFAMDNIPSRRLINPPVKSKSCYLTSTVFPVPVPLALPKQAPNPGIIWKPNNESTSFRNRSP